MREILFRGKAINRVEGQKYRTNYKNGDWVYGLVSRLYDERFKNLPAEMTNTNGISNIDVDYKTIGQFTGLTDKNGKKIFEGDILPVYENGEKYLYKVIYECDCFMLAMLDSEQGSYPISRFNQYMREVVGNIHDNPELLK